MEKELLVRLDTGKAVSQMASNATDRLLIKAGNQFLPAKKELTSMWIDIANGITESLPDLSNIVNGILPMLHSALLELAMRRRRHCRGSRRALTTLQSMGRKWQGPLLP